MTKEQEEKAFEFISKYTGILNQMSKSYDDLMQLTDNGKKGCYIQEVMAWTEFDRALFKVAADYLFKAETMMRMIGSADTAVEDGYATLEEWEDQVIM